jgi:hypothetical protein
MIREGIASPNVSINDQESSLRKGNKNFEAAVRFLLKAILEENVKEILKDEFLESMPLKIRQEEAKKPMYLVRYE